MKAEHPAIVELRRRIVKGFEEKTLRAETVVKLTSRLDGKTEEEMAQIAEEILLGLSEVPPVSKKTLQERWDEEVLSDNTHVENCKQCKECALRDDGTVWSNHYTKSSCQRYPYPRMKPLEVINNKADCPFWTAFEE